MRRIQDVGQPFAGKTVTIVGAGETTADYLTAINTEDVVLINWGISVAPWFPACRLYHVSLHHECFGVHPYLRLNNVTQLTGDWVEADVKPDVADSTILFKTLDFPTLEDPELLKHLPDSSTLCHVQNSAHCAIHLTWHWGCRDLRVVGANGYRGLPSHRYDCRLNVPVERQPQGAPGWFYLDSFRRFVALFDWRSVVWCGY